MDAAVPPVIVRGLLPTSIPPFHAGGAKQKVKALSLSHAVTCILYCSALLLFLDYLRQARGQL